MDQDAVLRYEFVPRGAVEAALFGTVIEGTARDPNNDPVHAILITNTTHMRQINHLIPEVINRFDPTNECIVYPLLCARNKNNSEIHAQSNTAVDHVLRTVILLSYADIR